MFGPKITEAPLDGKMPWSTTVVNVNRMRARRRHRLVLLGVALGVSILLCFACGLGAKIYIDGHNAALKPTARPITTAPTTAPKPTMIAPKQTAIKPSPTPKPTATVEPVVATAFIMPREGPPGALIQASISAFNALDGLVIAWWDNEPMARVRLGGGQGALRFNVPDDADQGEHFITIDVSNGIAIKSIIVRFEVQ
jgi:hypothetical protein